MQETSTKFWFFLLGSVISIAAVFWPELTESWGGWVSGLSSETAVASQLSIASTDQITGFRLGGLVHQSENISVQNPQSRRLAGGMIELSFDLVGSSIDGTYPSLRVNLLDNNNRILRSVVYANSQYVHGVGLGRERITLNIHVLTGETSCTVAAIN